MIITQQTPEIVAMRAGSNIAALTFNKYRIYFSLYANVEFNLQPGTRVIFETKGPQLFMRITTDTKGFKLVPERKGEKYLKIESKPLVTLLQQKIGFEYPAKFEMQRLVTDYKTIEILVKSELLKKKTRINN